MYSDIHIHTSFSSDSNTPIEDQVERAIRRGMKQICITDHQDYDYPPWHSIYLLSETGDVDSYLKKLQEVQAAYADRIEMLIGIEFGLQPHLVERHNREYGQYPFDYVIGSTHCFSGRDTEDQTLYKGRSKEEAVREYFQTELDNITLTDGFDSIGHLDFVLRDIPGKNEGFTYRQYGDILDELLKTAIRKNKALELNTKSLVIGMRDSSPGADVFRRYRELGGELVTLGSDAHFPERIGGCFDIAGEILKDAGFKYYCIYKKHQPVFLPL
ncbi:histidinol-phosphatase HisJ family protein [Oscillibacter sp. MSJ-2]|uniref:Histidinol-phosphatase n=1 Tax=Dysosmobacter acutus TaxID=2841504 RepID=A0ABS6F783_9FIRM|nr:histidinol-phosphatase HisJ family protein [Dysosmobacter acutus]MBU5625541.1 histidinol-phosphatase HisJ family protein [Dysosmobacter acutus]